MGEYFSEDLYKLLNGEITAITFRKYWGNKIEYDALNCIINIGDNTIIINEG